MKNKKTENSIDFLNKTSNQDISGLNITSEEITDFHEIQRQLENESLKHTFTQNKNKNWNKIEKHINNCNSSVRVIPYKKIITYAALLILGLIFGVLSQLILQNEQSEYISEIHVPNGQTSKVILSDSSVIWVNSGSTLKLGNFANQSERNIWLEGEAYFEVTHNIEKPFNVIGPSVDIQVLGTSFNANFYKEDRKNSVYLSEGSVVMKNKNGKNLITLKPSETAIINKDNNKLLLKHGGDNLFINWSNGRLILRNVTLQDLALNLERWYNVDIQFNNIKTKNITVSGTVLKNKPIDQMLEVIKLMSDINYKVISNQNEKDLIVFE